ncbi:hypothetical protein BT96DRAFT_952838 [Gymnopus androsaceus JB14]|uniref:SMP-30/Gluconolactonase/LRE-like region domain-containing protein n=1 Tax=Gymnopus androsaceus JB14 TaxID=1447944 RepID=A0A6A4IK70_9AGAR|nr:hypothetical protein BT96DRAFT_952838 [Gymnopus androsaceus JB14]
MSRPADRKIVVYEPLFKSGCTLGEGPVYDPVTATLHFVDIAERKVSCNAEFSGLLAIQHSNYRPIRRPITSISLRRNAPGLAGTTSTGFALLNSDGSLQYLEEPIRDEQVSSTRFNDGACDAKGRYFAGTAGTVLSPEDGSGKLYRYDPSNHTCTIVDDGPFTDSNGMGWSPDGKIFYLTDSLVNLLYAYDYDVETGSVSNRRTLVDAKQLGYGGYLDGLCVDTEGGIWSARWGDSRICRFTSAGAVDLEIIFPKVLHVTSCCFGGSNNDQLYGEYPDSGHLFMVDLAGRYKGLERHSFAG